MDPPLKLEGFLLKLPFIQYNPFLVRELTLADTIQVLLCCSHIPAPTPEYLAKRPQRVAQTHYDVGWCDGVCLVNSGILLGEFLHTMLPIS